MDLSYRNQSFNFVCKSIDYDFYMVGAFGVSGSALGK